MLTNHRMHTGPNSFETLAVPRDWMMNRAMRIEMVTNRIRSSLNSCPAPGSVLNPSTADKTDKAGVMIASP